MAFRTAVSRWFADTEEVTGSNPVAPTTVLAGQRADSSWRTALRTDCGRAAAAVCSPLNQMDPPEPDDRGPSPAQRPPSVVTTSRSNSMSATTPAACPGRTCGGPGSTCSFPCSPAHRRAPGAGPAPMVGQAASAAPQPVHMPSGGPGLASRLVRAAHCQRPTILPRQADSGRDDQAAHRPQRHVEPGAPTVAGPAAPTHSGSSAVRTARLQRARTPDVCLSGHPDHAGGVDTGRPGHRTSARPVGRTSVRTADSGHGHSNERHGRRPDILDGHDDGDRQLSGARPRSGCSVCGARHPMTAPRCRHLPPR